VRRLRPENHDVKPAGGHGSGGRRFDPGASHALAPLPHRGGLHRPCRGKRRLPAAVSRLPHRRRRPVQHWPE
nr:hypothetical protein [Tanacetum cinerariifolium]